MFTFKICFNSKREEFLISFRLKNRGIIVSEMVVSSLPQISMWICDDFDIKEQDKVQSTASVVRKIEEPRIRRFHINWKLTIIVSVLVSVFFWFVVGLLMGRGHLPRVDLGYTWFNSHIFRIF